MLALVWHIKCLKRVSLLDLKVGQKYWIIASWTAKGERPQECVWHGDFVDHKRKANGQIFMSKQEALEKGFKPNLHNTAQSV